jgi:hypothetical protein
MLKVYGPYTRADGRKHVIHYDTVTKERRTQSYPRYLMEQHLKRKLEDTEEVDHINGDFTDDRIENYQLLTKPANIKKSARQPEMSDLTCGSCGIKFQRRANQVRKTKSGKQYCSKYCAGMAGK